MSDLELYQHNSYKALGPGDTSLSGVPLKLNMTEPGNQKKAKWAWDQYRAQLNKPVEVPAGTVADRDARSRTIFQSAMNHMRIGQATKERYLGWPDQAIHDAIVRDEGLDPAKADMRLFNDLSEIPAEPRASMARGAGGVTQGGVQGSTSYIPAGGNPLARLGTIVHESIHPWAQQKFRDFKPAHYENQAEISGLNELGEEPAPHFPGGYHDRGIVNALEAERLATKYGGYPADISRASPWPMVRGRQ